MSILDGLLSLGKNTNKLSGEEFLEKEEGLVSDKIPELKLDMDDEDLIALKKQWEKTWNDSEAKTDLERKQKENEKYWLGDHYENKIQKAKNKRPLMDNLIFEAFESFLASITQQNPEPLVLSEDSQLAKSIKKGLIYLADVLKMKLKVRTAVRYWGLYYLGVIQIGWSDINNEIDVMPIRPQRLVLDPEAVVVGGEYFGSYLGKYRREKADDLISRFPNQKTFIEKKVDKKMGTKIGYMEWWTNDFLFWTLEDEVLGKVKNPHWNYDQEEEEPEMESIVNEFGEEEQITKMGEDGEPVMTTKTIEGNNHFRSRKIPFAFMTVYNLGLKPFDDTNQIEQVLSLQDAINKRIKQIDKNADNMNAGAVVSGDSFTKEQAAEVAEALRTGKTVRVPQGDVNRAYKRDQGAQLPAFVYNSLIDTRNELRGVFGTTGLTPEGIKSEETVRGKIIIRGQDASRGMPVTEAVEQFYDYIFNWMVQLMYVYYDETHQFKIVGEEESMEITKIRNSDLLQEVLISIKEGSLIPKDDLTKRNEAVDLWGAGAIDPIELYTRLDFPHPRESAMNLYLWQSNPAMLFPELQQQMAPQQQQPGQVGQPAEEQQTVSQELLGQVQI